MCRDGNPCVESIEEVRAVIVEPLVQCAGQNANIPVYSHPGLRELCNQYDIHLIADEIAVALVAPAKMFV